MKYLTTILSLVIPVALALGGYLFTYFYGKKQEQRKNRLERINRQLDELYYTVRCWQSYNQAKKHGIVLLPNITAILIFIKKNKTPHGKMWLNFIPG